VVKGVRERVVECERDAVRQGPPHHELEGVVLGTGHRAPGTQGSELRAEEGKRAIAKTVAVEIRTARRIEETWKAEQVHSERKHGGVGVYAVDEVEGNLCG